MRFPLPEDTFPPLRLPEQDVVGLQRLGAVFTQDALDQFAAFRTDQGGAVDETRWKLIRKRSGLASYSGRGISSVASPLRDEVAMSIGKISYSSPTLHAVLTVGTVDGSFEDMMFGLHHSSAEVQRVKSAYMEDKLVDSRTLATLDWPTNADPVRALRVRWAVSEFMPALLRSIVRPRDFVFLEATGVHVTPEGERIGYNILHSLQIPEIRELTDLRIVRGSFSIVGAFRQRAPGVVELFMKGFVDPRGDAPGSLTVPGTAEALMSYRKSPYCGQMKKLHWFLKTKRRRRRLPAEGEAAGVNASYLVDSEVEAGERMRRKTCVACSASIKPSRSNFCEVCDHGVCSTCRVTRRLSFLEQPSKRIVPHTLRFCPQCVMAAMNTDAFAIAAEEHRLGANPVAAYQLSSTGGSTQQNGSMELPSPSSSSVNNDVCREFFG